MIRFTRHAREKFGILARHGFNVAQKQVFEAIRKPDLIDHSRWPLKIAQRNFDKTHVLRVVFREEGDQKVVITFYPGRKSQYEK